MFHDIIMLIGGFRFVKYSAKKTRKTDSNIVFYKPLTAIRLLMGYEQAFSHEFSTTTLCCCGIGFQNLTCSYCNSNLNFNLKTIITFNYTFTVQK